jgi:IS5 family transposase
VQAKMAKSSKIRASRLKYISTSHVLIPGFETPFDQNLDPTNRWVILANKIPWDKLVKIYENQLGKSNFGASKINGRIAIGSVIIKHLNNLSDRDVVAQLQENVYMQYFVGLSSFCNAPLYDPSLLVEFRNRLGMEELKEINEIIVANWAVSNDTKPNKDADKDKKSDKSDQSDEPKGGDEKEPPKEEELKGSLIIDATAVPQDIAYPTDLNLLSEAREILEALIDHLYEQSLDQSKPRTYRERAHKEYLRVAQNRNPSRKTIRTAIKKQLQYVART